MVALRIMLAWLLVLGGSPVFAQTTSDPQALIGEWSGLATQISPRGAGSRGPYTLSIERVEGVKVYGWTSTTTIRHSEPLSLTRWSEGTSRLPYALRLVSVHRSRRRPRSASHALALSTF